MLFNLIELVDLVVMTAAVCYILMDFTRHDDPLLHYGFDWKAFRLSCIVAAPAVVFHELGHKFAALAFGLKATLHADYMWLLIGSAMKMLNTGLIFFVPGYVSISGVQSPLVSAATAFAGPAVNLVLWAGSRLAIKFVPSMKLGTLRILALTSKINGFLFVFNMLPIFYFDGYKVFAGIISWLWP